MKIYYKDSKSAISYIVVSGEKHIDLVMYYDKKLGGYYKIGNTNRNKEGFTLDINKKYDIVKDLFLQNRWIEL